MEAASKTFFGESAKNLTLMEGAFLAGNTQGPEIYDPYNNREVVNERVRQVLELVKNNYGSESCSGVTGKACYTYQEIENAINEIENYQFQTPPQGFDHTAWVDMVEGQLHEIFPGDSFYTAGVIVKTTIDQSVQKRVDEALSQTFATDSIVIWDKNGAIQAIGGDVFPDKITIRTPDGVFSLLEFAEGYEFSRGNIVSLHAIDKITKIKNGKVVAENPPLVKTSLESDIAVDQSSVGETVTLPDNKSSAVRGYSQTADGFRYNWIIGEKNGRNFIYWTSDKDPQTALLTFQDIVNRINSGKASQVNPDILKSSSRSVLPGAKKRRESLVNIVFDERKGAFVLDLPPISASMSTLLPGYTFRDLGNEEHVNKEMLLNLQNSHRKNEQVRKSQNAKLREDARRAGVDIPRSRGRI